jgi:hypothetical protein
MHIPLNDSDEIEQSLKGEVTGIETLVFATRCYLFVATGAETSCSGPKAWKLKVGNCSHEGGPGRVFLQVGRR